MAGVELANAWVNIIPSTKEIAPGVRKALGAVDESAAKAGTSMGQKLSGAITKTLKVGAASAGVAVGGILAGSIAKGFGRMTAIEGAEAKLKGLGNSAADVAGIMDNALASVKGTANGLGEAAAVSASMVAAGIKPGQELEQTLKTVGDTAAIAGRSMQDVGLIFGSIAARGKLQGDDMLQLMSSGIPVLQLLAQETGKTSAEISEMVSKGQIDFATFERAMRNGMGGAALEMGKTFQGSLKNMNAAMGRFGEALIKPAFTAAPPLFNAIGGAFDAMARGFAPASEKLNALLVPAFERVGKAIEGANPVLEQAAGKMGDFVAKVAEFVVDPETWEFLGRVFGRIGEAAQVAAEPVMSLVRVLIDIGQSVSTQVWDALINVLEALAPVLETVVVPALQQVADFAKEHPEVVGAMVTAWLGMQALNKVTAPLRGLAGALLGLGKIFVMMKFASEMSALAAATQATNPALAATARMASRLTTAFNPLGGVLKFIMNPVKTLGGLFVQLVTKINPIVAVISIVAGALWLFFTKTETGRKMWQAFVDAISVGWDWVVQKTQAAVAFLSAAFSAASAAVSAVFSQIWAVVQPIAAAIWGVIQQIGQVAINIFGGVLAVVLGLAIVAWNGFSAMFSAAWENWIKPVFDGFGLAVTVLYQGVILPVVGWIIAKWNTLSAALSIVWAAIKVAVIDAFSAAMTWLWQNVISPVIDWIVGKWNTLSAALSIVWAAIKVAVIDAFSAAMTWLWQNVISPVIDWIVGKWNWLSQAMSVTWQWISSNIIERFKSSLETLKSFFGTVVDGIRNVWNGLKAHLAGPINFMINTVYNDGIAKAWDTIGGFLPLNPKTARRLTPISGYAAGGAIRGPGTGTSDDILAWLSNGEHVWRAAEVKALGGQGAMYAMRSAVAHGEGFTFDGANVTLLPRVNNRVGDLAGAAPSLFPAFANGGAVRPMWELQLENAHRFARAQHGKPYQWAGPTGPGSSFDCSGFMGAIAATMQGTNPWQRYWATMSFPSPGAQGFVPGLGPGFSIGIFNGGPYGGHTAGTLGPVGQFSSTNVESGGSPSMVKYGIGAAGADHRQFTMHYHLPIGADGAFVSGGAGGVSPEQMKKTIGERAGGILKRIMSPIKGMLPAGPPEWKEIPRHAYDKGMDAFPKAIAKTIDGLKDKLSTVYAAVSEVAGDMWDTTRSVVSLAGRSIGLHDQGGWLQSGNLALNLSGKPEPVLTNSQWGVVAAGIRTIGDLIPVLGKIADRESEAGIAARAMGAKFGTIAGSLGFDGVSKVTSSLLAAEDALADARTGHAQRMADIAGKETALQSARQALADAEAASYDDDAKRAEAVQKATDDVAKAESDLAAARKKSAEALDVRIFDVAPQISGVLSQAAAATSAVPAVSGALAGLAAAAGPAGMSVGMAITAVEQAISVAKVLIDVIDKIVGGVMKARVEVAKAFASSMDAIGEIAGMIDKQRETVAGLRIDFAMAQIEVAAALRQVRITQMDGVRAQLESTKTLAEAQAAFDAQRQADMRAAAAQYTDLSLAFDRFRWAAKAGVDGALDSMAAWSDETHALFADLQAARIGQLIAEREAQKANLEATYKAALAVLNLQEVSTNLGYATQQLALMSGKSFGFTSSSALIGSKVADLYAEKAQLQAQQGQNWWKLFSWHMSGASSAAAQRAKQIDQEIAKLQAMPEWEGFTAAQQKTIDQVMAKAGWAGFTGGGDYLATMLKNSALGDPQRALDEIKLQADLLALKKQQEDLQAKIDKGAAEIDFRGKLDPLETEISALEMEKGSQQAWAEFWRAENAGVRDALAELARYQAESAKQVKTMAEEAKQRQPITLVGSTANMDDVQALLEQLGHRVDRLEKPAPTAAAVAAARR